MRSSSRASWISASAKTLVQTVDALESLVDLLEKNRTYRSLKPFGEPQLGQYGLYPTLGSRNDRMREVRALLWLLNLSDGRHDLLAIAERSGAPLTLLAELAERCLAEGLLAVS